MSGRDEIGVRGAICESVSIVGPGGPGGVKAPWPKAERLIMNDEANTKAAARIVFIGVEFREVPND